MIPTINVNLRPCRCPVPSGSLQHMAEGCAAAPLLIPCPIQRSVTLEVRSGECSCEPVRLWHGPDNAVRMHETHHEGCPAHPVRVSCSISGKTWEESEVTEMDFTDPRSASESAPFWAACRERWALVKALVLGQRALNVMAFGWKATDAFITQRDGVFASLVKARAHEDGLYEALGELPTGVASAAGRPSDRRFTFAEDALGAYVMRLIEQVRVL